MSRYYTVITERQHEQAGRMALKWIARAEAFYVGGSNWGFSTAGFCKSRDDADQAEQNAERILDALQRFSFGCGTQDDILIIKEAVAGCDELDAGISAIQDERRHGLSEYRSSIDAMRQNATDSQAGGIQSKDNRDR